MNSPIANLATEQMLEAVLCAAVFEGVRAAWAKTKDAESQRLKCEIDATIRTAAEVLFPVLPGVCVAQIREGFRVMAQTKGYHIMQGISMDDVVALFAQLKQPQDSKES